MDSVVISIGGSVLVPNENDADYLKTLAGLLSRISSIHKLYIVTGGGRIARYYITSGRVLGASEKNLDEFGIEVTRLNARLLSTALGDLANPKPALNIDEATELGKNHQIVVMGGTEPGHTTDAVSAMLADKIGAARLVNATSVDGVYDSDPKKNKDAKRFKRVSHEELVALTSEIKGMAGPTVIFDPKGSEIIKNAKIPLYVCHGRDLGALENAVLGKDFDGTIVD
ncbi:MAG: UMP kinase [Thermoplasmata archaeon]|nr:MAG: UMP kinase [Thermoplasmata archaeon]